MEATKLWICYLTRAPMLILKVSKPAPFVLVFCVCWEGEGRGLPFEWGGGRGILIKEFEKC